MLAAPFLSASHDAEVQAHAQLFTGVLRIITQVLMFVQQALLSAETSLNL